MTAPTTIKHQFTAETARQFEGYSQANALILSCACPDCIPYEDWFTYNRWLAQGYQVQRGQHGTKLEIYVERPDRNDQTKTVRIPWHTTVFCKHQVAKIELEQ